tara:strand:+ start:19422 stop:20126 length:705 start_codon:yes stop_codon:yes gene_type:complete
MTTLNHHTRYRVQKLIDSKTAKEFIKFCETKETKDGIESVYSPFNTDTNLKNLLKNNKEATINQSEIQFPEKFHDNLKDLGIWIRPKFSTDYFYSTYEKGCFYKAHLDSWNTGHFSHTLFLTNPKSYEGGELELLIDGKLKKIKPSAGYVVSYETGIPHQVLEVKSGVRKALVWWTTSIFNCMQDLYESRWLSSKASEDYLRTEADITTDLKYFASIDEVMKQTELNNKLRATL